LHKGYGRPLAIRFQTVSDEILTLANWQIFLAVKNSLVGAGFAKTLVKKLKLLTKPALTYRAVTEIGLTQSNLRKTNGREFEGFALNWGVAPNPLKSGFYLSQCVSPEKIYSKKFFIDRHNRHPQFAV
jgi:hypothetical protein